MNTGIYLLDFLSYGVYVGKTIDFDRRYIEHVQSFSPKGPASTKMREARNKLGKPPALKILCRCHEDWLDKLEGYFIRKYASYTDGTILLNTSVPKCCENIPSSLINDTHPVLSVKLFILDNWYSMERYMKTK